MKIFTHCLFCNFSLDKKYIDHYDNAINYDYNSCQNINCMYMNKTPRFAQCRKVPIYFVGVIIDYKTKSYLLNISQSNNINQSNILIYKMNGFDKEFFSENKLSNSENFSIKLLEQTVRKSLFSSFR